MKLFYVSPAVFMFGFFRKSFFHFKLSINNTEIISARFGCPIYVSNAIIQICTIKFFGYLLRFK